MPAAPEIHAHRGGPLLAGIPVFAEQTMPAFHHAALVEGAALELDVRLTRDRVPVVIHDETIDRTTDSVGRVAQLAYANLRTCSADVLGTASVTRRVDPFIALPSLAEVLAFARDHDARLNIEIKNLPGEEDFDPSEAHATTIAEVVAASRFPQERLQIQSFWATNLEAVRPVLPRATLGFLTRPPHDESAIVFAAASGYQVIGPTWPVPAPFVASAHAAGLRVIPHTVNEPDDVLEAAEAGVDGIITDDPVMARRTLAQAAESPTGQLTPVPPSPQ